MQTPPTQVTWCLFTWPLLWVLVMARGGVGGYWPKDPGEPRCRTFIRRLTPRLPRRHDFWVAQRPLHSKSAFTGSCVRPHTRMLGSHASCSGFAVGMQAPRRGRSHRKESTALTSPSLERLALRSCLCVGVGHGALERCLLSREKGLVATRTRRRWAEKEES